MTLTGVNGNKHDTASIAGWSYILTFVIVGNIYKKCSSVKVIMIVTRIEAG